jgi:hypothetical protein
LWASTPLAVGERDLIGVAVTLQPGVPIRGRILFDGAGVPPDPRRASIQIRLLSATTPSQLSAAPKRIEPDGSFATGGFPPGRYDVTATMPAAGWRMKSVTWNGRDVGDDGLDVRGQPLNGVTITFTDRQTGRINQRRLRTVRATSAGRFVMNDVPAGAYFIAAVPDAALPTWEQLFEVLESLSRVAERLTITDGQTVTRTLTTTPIR